MVLRGSEVSPRRCTPTRYKLMAGATAGAIARSVVAPIDRVKISLQTGAITGNTHTSTWATACDLYKREGTRGFWKGNGVNCLRVAPHTAVQFSSYDIYKSNLTNNGNGIGARLICGALAGATAATITHPLDSLRIRLQTESEISALRLVSKIAKNEGIRGFYRGYVPTLCSLTPFIAINFATFDTLKSFTSNKEDTVTKNLILGASSGAVAQTLCFPLDTLRRRMQVGGQHYSSMRHAVTEILSKEGVPGFYKGIGPNLAKIIPNNGIRFAVFGYMKSKEM